METSTPIDGNEQTRIIAQAKMNKLLSPGFGKFGIRFYNIGEYQKMIETQCFQGKEAGLYGDIEDKKPFGSNIQEFLQAGATRGWGEVAGGLTAWLESSLQIHFHTTLQRLLRAEPNEIDAVTYTKNVRHRLAAAVAAFRSKYPYLGFTNGRLDFVPHLQESLEKAESPQDIQALLQTLKDTPGGQDHLLSGRPYHVGVFFDPSVLYRGHGSVYKTHGSIWYPFWPSKKQDGSLLLGAVSLFEDDALTLELKKISSHGEWSHAFFDASGKTLFPEQK